MTMRNSLTAAALALLITGCSTSAPSISEYTIIPPYPPHYATGIPADISLRIAPTKSITSLASKEFYYLREPSQTGAYLYSRWSDTPASMIERSLVTSLQERRLFGTLLPASSNASADLTLESELHAFYHRFRQNGSNEGLIDITYRLIATKNTQVIASKRFVIISPSLSADAKGGVNALSNATRDLNQQTALWLETALKNRK